MSSMTLLPTLVFPFQGVLLFPPESAPVATKSPHATPKGLIEPLMFGPNISGEGDWVFGGYASTGTFTGSMYHVSLQNLPGATGGNDYYNGKPGIGIDASRSSSIYKASSTVQPASVRLLACIKI